jgi:hypothetical protein
MTELLARAFSEASKLSAKEQDALAAWILDEITSEHRWDEAFSSSHDALAGLASEARTEHKKGRTQLLEPDKL